MTVANLGGIHGKLGNRYEAKWLVRQLLEVYSGRVSALTFEGIGSEFAGFEASVTRPGRIEWHQTKISRAGANWTVHSLSDVLEAFGQRLATDTSAECVFVSQDPARDLRHVPGHARDAQTLEQFTAINNKDEGNAVKELQELWKVSREELWQRLRRCSFRTESLESIEGVIGHLSDRYFTEPQNAFAVLRDYLEDRFNVEITTETVRSELRASGKLGLKPFEADPTILEKIRSETLAYLDSYIPFGAGGSSIPRKEAGAVVEALKRNGGPYAVLLTGVAGSGKSGVVRGVVAAAQELGIATLAFRIDQFLDCSSARDVGEILFGRPESPVVTLKRVCPDRTSLIIIDQIDAVSEVAGRGGSVRETVLAILQEAQTAATVRILLVCRDFDLEADRRLKVLDSSSQVSRIRVPVLNWETEVEAFLKAKNIDPATFTPNQRTLLCLPINLALFLEGAREDRSFRNRADLFDRLMDAKTTALARRGLVGPWEPLAALAQWMSDRQRLDAPAPVLDPHASAKQALLSEHLIVTSRGGVSLFHESFFDYLFARRFSINQQSLLDLLLSTEQHLFRRTQVRQILDALRQQDRARYVVELRSVFLHPRVRAHIKNVIALWLATAPDPTTEELEIVIALDVENGPLPRLLLDSIQGSAGWFDVLTTKSWWASQLGRGDDGRSEQILHLLDRLVSARGAAVATLLEQWWDGDPERARVLVRWFAFADGFANDAALTDLLIKVLGSDGGNLSELVFGQDGLLLSRLEKGDAAKGAKVLRAAHERWFEEHPGQHPFSRDAASQVDKHTLGELASKQPSMFILGGAEALVRSIYIVKARKAAGEYDHEFEQRPSIEAFGGQALLAHYRIALCQIAESQPALACDYLDFFDPKLHRLLLHLHLETITASRGALATHLVDLLECEGLEEAGWDELEWKSFADAAAVSMRQLSPADRLKVEARILSLAPELAYARELARDVANEADRSKRDNDRDHALWRLRRSGFVRRCVLASIDRDLLSPKAKAVLKEANRKFGTDAIPAGRRQRGGWVRSPIDREQVAKMTDAQWLSAIEKYDGTQRRWDSDFLKGDAEQLGHELQEQAKANPVRFANLAKQIPIVSPTTYINQVLIGLSDSDVPDSTLADIVLLAFERAPIEHGGMIVQAIRSKPQLCRISAIWDVLAWYIRNGEARDPVILDNDSDRRIVTINDLLDRGHRLRVRGLSGSRAAAAEALENVLWHVPEAAGQAGTLIEERIAAEGAIGVRCSLVAPLLPWFNVDKFQCAKLLDLVSLPRPHATDCDPSTIKDPWTAPLATMAATKLMPFIIHHVPSFGERLVDRLLASDNELFRQVGFWHAIGASFSYECYRARADDAIEASPIARRLAASRAASALHHQEFRERAEQQLIRFFDDPDPDTQSQASDTFREIDGGDLDEDKRLATIFIGSAAFRKSCWPLLRALERSVCDTQDLVIAAAESLIEDLEANGVARGRQMSELHTLQDLLKRDYTASEGNPELRKKLLDLIDRMIAGGYYGTEKILKEHERL